MRLAIYSKQPSTDEIEVVSQLILHCKRHKTELALDIAFYKYYKEQANLQYFSDSDNLQSFNPDFLLAVGGDGTVLHTLLLVKDNSIPVLGINTGRLGFLANIKPNHLGNALQLLHEGKYKIEKRSVLELKSNTNVFEGEKWSLNDFSIHKRDTSSMITIDTFLNGEHFNTYWADGLLIATPTGSTAYSLSCGGPVMFPDSSGFVITPVAPHNLNVRPVVISDTSEITFRVSGRGSNFLIALDSRNQQVNYDIELSIKKAAFKLNFARLEGHFFVQTLQEKLNWGKDNRNMLE